MQETSALYGLDQMAGETVSFLLTDIEGSTPAWERAPDAMGRAMSLHDRLVDEIVSRFGGGRPLEQGEGDSSVSSFLSAGDAVACALELQRTFQTTEWPEPVELWIRMGLHTGDTQIAADGNYYGPTMIRAARLRALAHGGQILISQSLRVMVQDHLPLEASLSDMGMHRLKGMSRPERIYQLCHPSLRNEFPPLASEGAKGNIPIQLTAFVGREKEKRELLDLLDHERLVTLAGVGGAGKTRLSTEVASAASSHFPQGAWFVELAPRSGGGFVANAIGETIGVRERTAEPYLETLKSVLGDLALLIVLDNCEHVIEEGAQVAEALLSACPGVKILATSREPLGVPGEVVWRIPPLDASGTESRPTGEASDAIRLFMDRALRMGATVDLEKDREVLEEICARLDGLPLAIELAAARTRHLSPGHILKGLKDRLVLLSGGSRTALPRQKTLEGSVAWSFDLLDDAEKSLFVKLSVFAGSFSVEAANEICGGATLSDDEIFDLLCRLSDKSLIVSEDSPAGPRYRMLETVRAYGRKRLAAERDERVLKDRHLDFYLELVLEPESAGSHWDAVVWMDKLEMEHDDLREATDWSLVREDRSRAFELCRALPLFWLVRGYIGEGREWLQNLFSESGGDAHLRSKALVAACPLWFYLFDLGSTASAAQEALEVARSAGDRETEGRALNWQGWLANVLDPSGSRPFFEEAISLSRGVSDSWGLAYALNGQGFVDTLQGHSDAAEAALREAAALAEEAGDTFITQQSLAWLGWGYLEQGRYAETEELFHRSLRIADRLRDDLFRSVGKMWLGVLYTYKGDYALAGQSLSEAEGAARRIGNPVMIANALGWVGFLKSAAAKPGEAVEPLEACISFFRGIGANWFLATYLTILGHVVFALGDTEGAEAHWTEALQIGQTSGQPWSVCRASLGLASLARAAGDGSAAEGHAFRALEAARGAGFLPGAIEAAEVVGSLCLDAGRAEDAARVIGWCEGARAQLGYVRFARDEQAWTGLVESVRGTLGETFSQPTRYDKRSSIDDLWMRWDEAVGQGPGTS